jgi:hypothetical protein
VPHVVECHTEDRTGLMGCQLDDVAQRYGPAGALRLGTAEHAEDSEAIGQAVYTSVAHETRHGHVLARNREHGKLHPTQPHFERSIGYVRNMST